VEAASQQRPYLVQFVLARFYQNMGEVVHERYEARRSFQITPFVQSFAQLHQFIVDPQ
jgi:hypothetical protein